MNYDIYNPLSLFTILFIIARNHFQRIPSPSLSSPSVIVRWVFSSLYLSCCGQWVLLHSDVDYRTH